MLRSLGGQGLTIFWRICPSKHLDLLDEFDIGRLQLDDISQMVRNIENKFVAYIQVAPAMRLYYVIPCQRYLLNIHGRLCCGWGLMNLKTWIDHYDLSRIDILWPSIWNVVFVSSLPLEIDNDLHFDGFSLSPRLEVYTDRLFVILWWVFLLDVIRQKSSAKKVVIYLHSFKV